MFTRVRIVKYLSGNAQAVVEQKENRLDRWEKIDGGKYTTERDAYTDRRNLAAMYNCK